MKKSPKRGSMPSTRVLSGCNWLNSEVVLHHRGLDVDDASIGSSGRAHFPLSDLIELGVPKDLIHFILPLSRPSFFF